MPGERGLNVTLECVTGLLIGYARCSTDEQDLTAQRETLRSLGCTEKRIYLDHANLHELFGVLTVPTFADARRNSAAQYGVYRAQVAELGLDAKRAREQLSFARRLAYAETFAQWLGARSIRKKPPRGIFRSIERFVVGK